MAELGLDGFIVPHADAHQNEFLPPSAERLAWLTGFTGSAGTAVVLTERAAIFVDGRYTLQVRDQVSSDLYEFYHPVEIPVGGWIADTLTVGKRLGIDPWLHTQIGVERLRRSVASVSAELVFVEVNPVDEIWVDQPAPPMSAVLPHDERFAGCASAEKRLALGAALGEEGLDAAILTQPDSIAWLLNVRGADVEYAPLVLSFAILHDDTTVDWFVAPEKLTDGLTEHLGTSVAVCEPEAFATSLVELAGKSVLVDPDSAPAWVFDRLKAADVAVVRGNDPVTLPKAIKNETELAGARAAHLRDGVALARFLHWLSEKASGGDVDEISAARKLAVFREDGEHFRGQSFATISGTGPNGAIVHYRVTEETNRLLVPGELYLVDSGAQYLDGTTDVTRTVAIGAPSEEMRDRFTRVLKGHIALAKACFPVGTSGAQLDGLARQALWRAGLDFDHGTGHGVGSYLCVHEGPQRISKAGSSVALQAGMIVSNEPGYYKEGAYGIRIENLVAVRVLADVPGGDRKMLDFETLTLAPIDRNLIDLTLLTPEERAWMDAYHARVAVEIGPLLDGAVRDWLMEATAPF